MLAPPSASPKVLYPALRRSWSACDCAHAHTTLCLACQAHMRTFFSLERGFSLAQVCWPKVKTMRWWWWPRVKTRTCKWWIHLPEAKSERMPSETAVTLKSPSSSCSASSNPNSRRTSNDTHSAHLSCSCLGRLVFACTESSASSQACRVRCQQSLGAVTAPPELGREALVTGQQGTDPCAKCRRVERAGPTRVGAAGGGR